MPRLVDDAAFGALRGEERRPLLDLVGAGGVAPLGEFAISASRGDGIAELVEALVTFAGSFFGTTEGALVTRARQRDLLRQAADTPAQKITQP